MIVLDTNVLSELMRQTPDRLVLTWLRAQDPLDLVTTCITVAEIRRGIERLPDGKRRESLDENFSKFLSAAFPTAPLVFGLTEARVCGELSATRERAGLHADPVDMMIAASVATAGASLATRNTGDFEQCGLSLVNPWEAKPAR